MVKRAIAAVVGALIGALISLAVVRWMEPHADPRAGACLPTAYVVDCASLEAPTQAEAQIMPVACKDWLGGGDGEIGRLSDCLRAARASKGLREFQRARAVAGSI